MSASQPLRVNAGLQWIGEGFSLVWRRPLTWLALTVFLFGLALFAAMLPAVGNLVLYTFSPAILGSMLLVAHQLAGVAAPDWGRVGAALRAALQPLLALGMVYTLIQVGLLMLLATASPDVLQALRPSDAPALPPPAESGALPMLLLVLVLSVPATMLMWFAPALIVFRGMRAWPAMRYSLAACLYHWRACLANGVAMFVLLLLASLPAMLGLLLWVPLMIGTLYCAYRDIFGLAEPDAS